MTDIILENIKVVVPNKVLLQNTSLKVVKGRKYALIGRNGVGKTTLLKQIATRILPVPKHIDIYYVEQESISSTEKTVYETVISANRKRLKLLKELEELESDLSNEKSLHRYVELSEKVSNLDVYKDESIVRCILSGLGFNQEEQDSPTCRFSGGWRMRISLAEALYMRPKLLLLDEPTNHLDLEAVVWLTHYLQRWKNTLIVITHSMDFLNEVCTDVVHLSNQKLNYYRGNYNKFLKGLELQQRTNKKEWKKVQSAIKGMRRKNATKLEIKVYLDKNSQYAPEKPYKVNLDFGEILEFDHTIVSTANITFGFGTALFRNINLEISSGDRLCIVGKNGVGKSTFLKLLYGELQPTSGYITRDSRAKVGYYHQHATDVLPLELNAVQHLQTLDKNLDIQSARKILGTIGLDSKVHLQRIDSLSGGQKSRVLFASLFVMHPNLVLLDEPTNHLDLETIEALIDSINKYTGAVILVTHDINLIESTECNLLELVGGKLVNTNFEEYCYKILNEK